MDSRTFAPLIISEARGKGVGAAFELIGLGVPVTMLGQLSPQQQRCLLRRQELAGSQLCQRVTAPSRAARRPAQAIAEAEQLEIAYRSEPALARVSLP